MRELCSRAWENFTSFHQFLISGTCSSCIWVPGGVSFPRNYCQPPASVSLAFIALWISWLIACLSGLFLDSTELSHHHSEKNTNEYCLPLTEHLAYIPVSALSRGLSEILQSLPASAPILHHPCNYSPFSCLRSHDSLSCPTSPSLLHSRSLGLYCCSVAQLYLTLFDLMDCSWPVSFVLYFLEFAQCQDSIEFVMRSNHLILCRPLLLISIVASIRVFSNESALCIRWPK